MCEKSQIAMWIAIDHYSLIRFIVSVIKLAETFLENAIEYCENVLNYAYFDKWEKEIKLKDCVSESKQCSGNWLKFQLKFYWSFYSIINEGYNLRKCLKIYLQCMHRYY